MTPAKAKSMLTQAEAQLFKAEAKAKKAAETAAEAAAEVKKHEALVDMLRDLAGLKPDGFLAKPEAPGADCSDLNCAASGKPHRHAGQIIHVDGDAP